MAKREIYVVFVACVSKSCFHRHCVHMPWDSSVAICVILGGKAIKLIPHSMTILITDGFISCNTLFFY